MVKKAQLVPALEWVSAGFGLLVAAGLLFIIGRDAMTSRGDRVPLLTVTAERVVAVPSGHVVEIVVDNRGLVTAAAVQVEGKVGEEMSSASIDHVPARSRARGGLLFRADPRAGRLDLRVTGYELP